MKKKKYEKSKEKQFESEEEDSSNSDLEVIEALLARRYPFICFSCEEVGHIVARCPNREDKDEKKHRK